MPYYFDDLDTPIEQDRKWDLLQEMWDAIHAVLMRAHFETKDEALAQKYKKSLDPDDMRIDSWNVVRYRETDDRENLKYFHDMGLEALAYTEAGIKNRKLDTEFIYYWSQLTSCHGYVCAAIMARGDDMQSKRAGAAGRAVTNVESQQQWYSHYFLRERPDCKNREEVEYRIERLVNAITDGKYPEVTDEQQLWCEKLLSLEKTIKIKDSVKIENPRYGKLTKSFHKDTPSIKKMKELVKLPIDGLPPLDLDIPPL